MTSIISDPATDPHSYEPTVADARQVSAARLVIVNGLGYDRWASQLVAASPAPDRVTLDVGSVLHLHTGENPHRWYDPANVETVAQTITNDLTHVDPAHTAGYAARLAAFEQHALAPVPRRHRPIRRAYAGVPVGASESIFVPLAHALGLDLRTPPELPERDRRGHRGERRRREHRGVASSPTARSRCGSTTIRTSPRRSTA